MRIKNWDKYQSKRKDRDGMPWVKLHRRALVSPTWHSMTDIQKAQFISLLLVADEHGYIPTEDPNLLMRMTGLQSEVEVDTLEQLNLIACGEFASDHKVGLVPSQQMKKVYFVQVGGLVKIGVSSNPHARLATIKTSNPKAKLLGWIHGTQEDEYDLHKKLVDYRYDREWFRLTKTTIEIISKMYYECHGSVLLVNREEEKEVEVEKEVEESLLRKDSKARNILCPKDWKADIHTVDGLRTEGYSDSLIERSIREMRDWSQSNNKRKRDWDATLRNWVRRAAPVTTSTKGQESWRKVLND